MEFVKEALLSRNILAWVILIVVIILLIKFIRSAGAAILILGLILGLVYVLHTYFPGVVAPLVEFVRGGWLN